VKENPDPNSQSREDEWLTVRCQLGERPAFDELIQRWNAPLWEYLRRAAGEDEAARDLVQEVWLRVLRGIGRLREGSKLRPWLFGIARRALMDRLRTKYATPEVSDVDLSSLALAEVDTDLEADLANLQLELARLPFTEREVLTLFYLRELSLSEVAEVLAVPVGTVKSRLFRARQLLRHELESQRRPV
jgi:RNA polymerase sigma-70 factor (ECF subfamily)